jgi:poly(3-hydroxybutyrate) depolymerase
MYDLCARWIRAACATLMLLGGGGAQAQFSEYDFGQTACAEDGGLRRAGFEARDREWPGGGPSAGLGGGPLGNSTLSVEVPPLGETRDMLLFVPVDYDAARPLPLVVVLHGAPGSAAAAPAAADAMRSLWSVLAEREDVIVLAPIAAGSQGGWLPDRDQPAIACALATLAGRYPVDLDRRYLWGFSAGAHFGHALALGNAGRFAAYAINAGALYALACGAAGTTFDCAVELPAALRPLPVQLRVGTNDALRGYVLGDYGRLQQAGWEPGSGVAYSEFSGGHGVSVADAEAAWAWFAPRRRPH